jgi:hypothetical protein
MKTLANHVIIYDDECPMCNLYTNAFVATGMLGKGERCAYSESNRANMPEVDWQRAKNEIALISLNDRKVTYGVNSLLTVVGNCLPLLAPLFSTALFQFVIGKLYMLISFNRKVIAPGKEFESPNSCTPDMNYRYRWLYIVFTWIFTSAVLVNYSRLMTPLIPVSSIFREFLVCGGQIIFQGMVAFVVNRKKVIHYLGNMMTVSLMGAIALLPAFAFKAFINTPYFYAAYFLLVVALMFLEHWRRVSTLRLPWIMSASWVAYRFVVLFIIL